MGCLDFEIAIERRLHGALDGAAAAELEAHLRTCASCRAYAASAGRWEETMGSMADEALRRVDWPAVDRKLRGALARLVAGFAAAVLAAAVAVPLFAWSAAPGRRAAAALSLLIGIGLVLVTYAVAAGLAARRMMALQPGEETLAFLRRTARFQVRTLLAMRAVLPAFAALGAWNLFASDGRRAVAHAVGTLIVLAAWAFGSFVKLPRVRRELRELEGGQG